MYDIDALALSQVKSDRRCAVDLTPVLVCSVSTGCNIRHRYNAAAYIVSVAATRGLRRA